MRGAPARGEQKISRKKRPGEFPEIKVKKAMAISKRSTTPSKRKKVPI